MRRRTGGEKGYPDARRGGSAPRRALAVVALAMSAGLVIGLVAGCGSSSPGQRDAEASARTRSAQARAVARQAGLDQSVQDFLARAAAAGSVTSTVAYDQGEGQTTVVMSRPPNRRIEISGAAGPGSVDRIVVSGSATFVCHLAGPRWTCVGGVVAAPSGPFTPDAVSQTIGALARLSRTHRFAVGERPMVGLVADCLTADRRPDQPADPTTGDHAAICIAPSGVILRVEGSGNPLQATSYKSSVPSGAFDLPAKATPVPTPATSR